MEKEKRQALNKEIEIINVAKSIGNGAISMFHTPWKLVVMISVQVLELGIWFCRDEVIKSLMHGYVFYPINRFMELIIVIAMMMLSLLILYLFESPLQGPFMARNLHRIGFVNNAEEAPRLVSINRVEDNKRARLLEFETYRLTLAEWKDKQLKIESALNYNISKVWQGKDNRKIIIRAIPAKFKLPVNIKWNANYLNAEDFKLALGEDLTGTVYWDLSVIPHGLIGGSTGSGKTSLLKCLLIQCIEKNCRIYIADFKGGVDFNRLWEKDARIITDKQEFLECLNMLTYILEDRKKVFKIKECKDIKEYNENNADKMPRLIMACDEIAAVLDKTGLNSEDKKLVTEIENQLSQIARQGRAFGIHLILGTQRPDATILTGQIKSNIDFRIAGRGDDTLSRIILDNTSASDAVPIDVAGRFITGDGTILQGYYFDA